MLRRLSLMLVLLACLVGCGHSEDEWQAQLAKYRDLNGRFMNQQGELAKAQARVKELSQQ